VAAPVRLLLLLAALFAGLGPAALPAPPGLTVAAAQAQDAPAMAQEPLVIETAAGERRFIVEVARSRAEQERGLMFRESLAPDRGMLFDWGGMTPAAMWMKNTLIPLDMLFIDADGMILDIFANTVPGSLDVITAGVPVRAVLELQGGAAKRLGLKPGDRVRHPIFTTR
jgi:uncharacterized membrane protein (UPF0127 family)